MKKKFLASFFAAICIFSLSACSAAESTMTTEEENKTNTEESVEDSDSSDDEENDKEEEKEDDQTESAEESEESSEETEESTEASEETAESTDASEETVESTEASEETTESTEASQETEESTEISEETAESTEISEETQESDEPTEETEGSTTAAPTELSDDIYDFQISIDGTVYQFPMWYSDFEALGGWEFKGDTSATLSSNQYSAAEVWEKDDIKIYTDIANLSINSVTFDQGMIAGITVDQYYMKDSGWEILLPKGIEFGVSGADDIIAAYGTPSDTYEGSLYQKLTYEYDSYQDIDLYVYNETGTLDKIELRNMIELEGADNSVDSTVPDIVKNYTAPESVGDDLYAFNIELEGNIYKLPCPVSVLLENGFTINENNSNKEFAAGGFGWVEFKYNNQTYRTTVRNYADYATTAENCFVTSMKSSIFDPDFQLTIPCDIKRGDKEEDVLKILENYNYELNAEDNSEFKYYTVFDPNKSKLDAYTITTQNGEVVIIEVSTKNKPE